MTCEHNNKKRHQQKILENHTQHQHEIRIKIIIKIKTKMLTRSERHIKRERDRQTERTKLDEIRRVMLLHARTKRRAKNNIGHIDNNQNSQQQQQQQQYLKNKIKRETKQTNTFSITADEKANEISRKGST